MTPIISVIVPVYNKEKFLRQCIESVLEQTFSQFELILVEDGSSDKSDEICAEYEGKDSRVKVIYQKNSGVSCARNVGMENSLGQYVMFLDSDDFFDKTMLQEYYDCAIKYEVDCVIGGLTYFFEDKLSDNQIFFAKRGKVKLPDEMDDWYEELENNRMLSSHCSKLFKKEIIDKNRIKMHPCFSILEDGMFVLDYLCECKSVYCIEKAPYYYRQFLGESLIKKYNSNALCAWKEYALKSEKIGAWLRWENQRKLNQRLMDYFMNFLTQVYWRTDISDTMKKNVLLEYIQEIHKFNFFKKKKYEKKKGVRQCFFWMCVRRKMVGILHLFLLAKYN